jgi:hypothetical protein
MSVQHEDANSSRDVHAHLRAFALGRAEHTIRRVEQGISQLESQGLAVTEEALYRVCGVAPKTLHRNKRAYALYQNHSQFHQQRRALSRKARSRRQSGQASTPDSPVDSQPNALPRLTKRQLIAAVRVAQEECDRVRGDLARTQMWYHTLLQEHMGCEQRRMALEAEVKRYQLWRTDMRREYQSEN